MWPFLKRVHGKPFADAQSPDSTFALWTAIATRNLRREVRYTGQAPILRYEGQMQSVPDKAAESSEYATSQV